MNRPKRWVEYLPAFLRRRIEGRPGVQRVLLNAGWLFTDKVIRLGLGLVVGLLVTRYLGPENFGVLSYATAVVALFSSVATLGLDGIVVRDIVRRPEETEGILGTAFGLKLVGGFLTLMVSLGYIFLSEGGKGALPWMVAAVGTGTMFLAWDAMDFWFQSQVLSKYTVIAKNAAFIVASAFRIVLILLHAGVVYFALAALIEAALGAAGLTVAYHRRGRRIFDWRPSLHYARALLSDSWPLILSGLSVMVYMRIGQILLKWMQGDSAVGQYSAALRFSEVWYFIPTILVSSVTPSIVRIRQEDEGLYYRRLQRLFSTLLLVSLSIAVPMTALSTPLITTVLGGKFAPAGPILTVHIWAAVFVFLGVGQGPWDVTEGLMRLSLLRTVGGAITNVALNLLLIPRWSGIGAAVAAVVSYALSAYVLNAVHPRTRRIFRCQTGAIMFHKVLRQV